MQQQAVRQSGQRIVLGEKGEPRFGAFALGDVHQPQQHRGPIIESQKARIDRDINQSTVGPDMLPGARRMLVGAVVAAPRRQLFESLDIGDS